MIVALRVLKPIPPSDMAWKSSATKRSVEDTKSDRLSSLKVVPVRRLLSAALLRTTEAASWGTSKEVVSPNPRK